MQMPPTEPVYIKTFQKGLLRKKREEAYAILKSCTLCPRACMVDRISGKTGICNTGAKAYLASYNPHFGEESPLVGTRGSGTIFFAHCNLLCNFCQNYDISHEGHGEELSDKDLASIMMLLQQSGCHNINFVTPSHVIPQILSAVEHAVNQGLSIPLIYNSGGYDRVETLKLLKGVFDIYMPDFKFWDPGIAETTCNAKNYPEVARQALVEMHRQVGDLVIDSKGIARHGLLIRHLVLPKALSGTQEIMKFISCRLSPNSYVNIMSQYRPCGRASEIKGLSSRLESDDYKLALRSAKEEGILRLDRPRRVFTAY